MKPEELYPLFAQHPKVSTDSRNIQPGCLFFALKGDSFNGNAFAADALEKGASYAIIDQEIYRKDERYLLVPDVLQALQSLAQHHRRPFSIPVLGITGTNGKTTTKELIRAVLSEAFTVTSTQGNLNNHIGVPLTLLGINPETTFAIIEMGANHPGEIMDLCRIAEPNAGLITSIGVAHLEGFGSLENIILTKRALYDYVAGRNGPLFVNAGQKVLKEITEGGNRILYGETDEATFRGRFLGADPFVRVAFESGKDVYEVHSRLIGSYNTDNILAAIAVGLFYKVPPEKIVSAIESYIPGNNRSQLLPTARNTLVMDAYNANPTSMKAAIESFRSMEGGPKAMILGDMFELGEQEEEEHLKILHELSKITGIKVFLAGPVFHRLNKNPGLVSFSDVSSLKDYLFKYPLSSYTILIKGSRGMALEKLLESV